MKSIIGFFKRFARFPELASVEPSARKIALRACRWQFLKYWQIWLAFIVNSLVGMTFIVGIFILLVT